MTTKIWRLRGATKPRVGLLYWAMVLQVVFLLGAQPAFAGAWSPIPGPDITRVAVADELDGAAYKPLRRCTSSPSKVGAEYWAVIVETTDGQGRTSPAYNNAVPYVDATFDAWLSRGVELDPARHVLVALGLNNRAIAIHPGTYWAGLGFAQDVITETIDGSNFKRFARAGDYPRAVCSLYEAIDAELARRIETAQALEKSLAQRFDVELREIARVEDRLTKMPLDPGAVAAQEAELTKARRLVDQARRSWKQGFMMDSEALLDQALYIRDVVDRRLDLHDEQFEVLSDLRKRQERLRAEIEERDEDFLLGAQGAIDRLDSCDDELERSTIAIAQLDQARNGEIVRCFDVARATMNNAEIKNVAVTRALPAGIVLFLLALVALWLFRRWRRRRRAGRRLADLTATWSDQLGTASDRLLDLETNHPDYFGPSKRAWVGESQELDQRCADSVNQAFLLLNEASELFDEARALESEAGGLDYKPVEQAVELLTTREVAFETGEREPRRRIFLPLTREYRGTANTLIYDLERTYAETIGLLQEVERVQGESIERAAQAQRLSDEIVAGANRRAELEADPNVLLGPAATPIARCDEARAMAPNDPIAATTIFVEAIATLDEVARRAELGNATLEELTERVVPKGRALSLSVVERRAGGMRLREDGFDPDVVLEHARRALDEARELVTEGREDEARSLADRLDANLIDLERKIELSVAGVGEIPKEVAALREARASLVERVPAARAALEELTAEHDIDAFRDESDNLDELGPLLERLVPWTAGIVAAHATENYLAAWADIDVAWQRLRSGDALITAIHDIRARLGAARDEGRRLRAQNDELIAKLALVAEAPHVGELWREAYQETLVARNRAQAEVEKERPNWFDVVATSSYVAGELARAEAEGVRFAASMERAEATMVDLRRALESLTRQVEAETRDRPHVAAAVQKVQRLRDQAELALEGRDHDGDDMLRLARRAAESLDWARGVWAAEMKLVRHATAEVRRVSQRIDAFASSYYGYGVRGDWGASRRQLQAALDAVHSSRWESALEAADRAEDLAESENDACMARVRAKEAEARRRAERARRERRARRASRSSSSSSSSYSSSSSSSSSSSFSSSSGGSSFGSSSGGSSW